MTDTWRISFFIWMGIPLLGSAFIGYLVGGFAGACIMASVVWAFVGTLIAGVVNPGTVRGVG